MSDDRWFGVAPRDEWAGEMVITVEPHGPGEAIYVGRDEHHHGLNVALVTETDPARWPAVRERLCAMRLDECAEPAKWMRSLASGAVTDQGDVTDTPEHVAPVAEAIRQAYEAGRRAR